VNRACSSACVCVVGAGSTGMRNLQVVK